MPRYGVNMEEKIKVVLDKELEDIFPAYLEKRLEEIPALKELLASGSLDEIKKIGHKLTGSGGSYGLDRLSEVGRDIEGHAASGDAGALGADIAALADFLARLEVVYE